MKRIINFMICFIMMVTMADLPVLTQTENVAAGEINFENVIKLLVHSINEQDWNSYLKLMSYEQQEFYNCYFNDDSYTDGVKQIRSIRLEEVIPVSREQVESELLYDEYPILKTSKDINAFIVSLNCEVYEENAYFYNGQNYYLIIVSRENDGQYRISQFNKPSFNFLKNILEKHSKNEMDEQEKIALKISEYAERGILINEKGNFITKGYVIRQKDKETGDVEVYDSNNSESLIKETFIDNLMPKVKTLSTNNYKDTPNLNRYTFYAIPQNITVCLNKTGNSKIVTVPLQTYIKNTLPNEWYSSWDASALRAGAYCVKGVAIYRAMRPVNANYMVTQGTQMYKPNSAVNSTNKQVDEIKNLMVVNSAEQIFFPEYGAGTKGEAGSKGSGRVLQWGTQYLATKKDKPYKHKKILNYYYKGSPYSSGKLKYVKS